MPQTCARCYGAFRGSASFRLLWCKVDEYYVCRRCWEWECHEGHGGGNKNVGTSVTTLLVFWLIVWLFAGSWAALAIADGLRVQSYGNLAVTPISSLPSAGLVEIRGTIVDDVIVAWGGRELSTRNGWVWEWSDADAFQVQDGSGVVNVTTDRWWMVEGTSHSAPNARHTEGSVYQDGDSVLLVGEVVRTSGGFRVAALYASPDGFRPTPLLPLALGSLGTLPFAVSLGAIVLLHRHRRSLHLQRVAGLPTIDIRSDSTVRDGSLPWRQNPRLSARGRWACAIAAGGASCAGAFAILFLLDMHSRTDFFLKGWLVALVLGFGVIVHVAFLLSTGLRPSALATTDRGVHFWYESPYDRRLADGFVGWGEIQFIGVRGSGKSTRWVLERRDGATDDLRFLSPPNFRDLAKEWERRHQIVIES